MWVYDKHHGQRQAKQAPAMGTSRVQNRLPIWQDYWGYPGGIVMPISSGLTAALSIITPTPTFAEFCIAIVSVCHKL